MASDDKEQSLGSVLIIMNSILIVVILIILVWLRVKRYSSIPLVSIIIFLVVNQLAKLLLMIPALVDGVPRALCLASIAGVVFFGMAASNNLAYLDVWLIFVAHVAYLERLDLGRMQVNLSGFIRSRLKWTYLPAVAMSAYFLFLASLKQTYTQSTCYKVMRNKQTTDYLSIIGAFILPNLIGIVGMLMNVYRYFKLPKPDVKRNTYLIGFSWIGVQLNLVDIVLKVLILIQLAGINGLMIWQIVQVSPCVSIVLLLVWISQVSMARRRMQQQNQLIGDTDEDLTYAMQLVEFGTQRNQEQ